MATESWSTFEVTERYSDATVTEATVHTVAAEYPHSTLNGTLTCSSHISTALYEPHIHVVSQGESEYM